MRKLVLLILMMITLCVSIPVNARLFKAKAYRPSSVQRYVFRKPRIYHDVYRYHGILYTPPKRERVRYSSVSYEKRKKGLNSPVGYSKAYTPVVHKGSLPVPIEHYQHIISFNKPNYLPEKTTVTREKKEREKSKEKFRDEFIRTTHDVLQFIDEHLDDAPGGDGVSNNTQWLSDSTKNESTDIYM